MPSHRKRRQFKQTDAFTRGMVIGLKRAGWSIRQIAADTHLGASTVHRLWRRWLEQGNVAIYRNVGATRVTSARVDRRILRQAVAAPQATCTAILQHVQGTLDHSISTRTISRRLVANGLHSCRPLRRLPLTPPNRRQRLEWCRARSTWMTEWHRVVFSDESRFCLSSDSRRVRVWRRRGERSNPAAIVERPTVRQRGIMVWGAIAYDSRSPLLRIQGTMTAQRYVDDVLRPVTLPYLQGVPNALYQQDNARPHTARISQQALQDVQMLPWPPHSPDLSPIEHVWDIIGRRLHALPQPRSEDELWQMVEREWRAIPQDAIRTLIDSLPRRVAACIAVRGLAVTFAIPRTVPQLKKLFPVEGKATIGIYKDLEENEDYKEDTTVSGIEGTVGLKLHTLILTKRPSMTSDEYRVYHKYGHSAYLNYRKFVTSEIQVNYAALGIRAFCNPYAKLKIAGNKDETGIPITLSEEVSYNAKDITLNKYNPWFTAIVCLVDLLTIVVILCIAKIEERGVIPVKKEKFSDTMLGGVVERFYFPNIWIGPNISYLIHTGAIYPPCLRRDNSIYSRVNLDVSYDHPLGCCVVPFITTSLVSTNFECFVLASGLNFTWNPKWPCELSEIQIIHRKPCCYGLLGECSTVIYKDCKFLGGNWHGDLDHCRQINCFLNICGETFMEADKNGPTNVPKRPLQLWRFFTAPFLHAGILHALFVTTIFWMVGRSIEQMVGPTELGTVRGRTGDPRPKLIRKEHPV
ncbi:hypothetical protein LAZ67_12000909 [Cordylochernes scorpioides]|uniref:Transposase n=1 Tax=Cordylochernes scorpioides TaxID=51811 RepID=A0ABY6L0X2_9ARAC|nr:hypothetical protein LAZ67_12000909 [Cordylochernes scorpioides]